MIRRNNPAGRNSLVELFRGKIGCEIGTEMGKYAEKIAQVADKLYCVDLWSSYSGYREHVSSDEYSEIYEDAKKRLSKYNVELIKGASHDVAPTFQKESLGFIYIDGNHEYSYIKDDLYNWYHAVVSGGIISGHDFVKDRPGFGVQRAVTEFCNSIGVDELTVFVGDRSPSWMFVKP
jgi:hypothetical protein